MKKLISQGIASIFQKLPYPMPDPTLGLCIRKDDILCCLKNQTNQMKCFEIVGHEEEAVKEALITQVGNIKRQRLPATIILEKEDYHYHLIEDIPIEESKKKEAVKWRLSEFLEYAPEEAVVDYIELPTPSHDAGHKLLYGIVAQKEKIEKHLRWAQQNNIQLVKIDIWQNAIKNILSLAYEPAGFLFLRAYDKQGELMIVKNKELCLMRKIDFPFFKFNTPHAPQESKELYEALGLEIQRSIDYCRGKIKMVIIDQILFWGPLSITFDPKALEAALGISTQNFLDNPIFKSAEIQKNLLAYAAVRDNTP